MTKQSLNTNITSTKEMQLTKKGEQIYLKKKEGTLDTFTWIFLKTLTKEQIHNVLISGYVAILFGRNRSSEDINLIIEPIQKEQFFQWWTHNPQYECLNTTNKEEAYDYLRTGHALRFANKATIIPNMEIKFPKGELDKWVLENPQKTIVNEHTIHISPIELQIAYKLLLGSEKDIEDAAFLHELFRKILNQHTLNKHLQALKVEETYEEYLT